MRLKSIKLAGFKSFVDPTTVNFPSNLSAVVGPNGCGKSNIIDAVRWVMGESSAKNLRGEAMTDVIFNGSNTRKPVGQASIELVFDNSDGKITGEYARYAEISVKRKVTRDGQNLYYLNGNKCRRRDITDIFLGTGLGPRSYAIIEQGMISRLIEAKPEDLRVYVEEAAGISKYKERRRDTENRMQRTKENLERLTDIREELERQISRLERQAQAAEKYKEFKQSERELKARLQAMRYRTLRTEADQKQLLIRDLELKVEAVVTQQVHQDSTIEIQRTRHLELGDTFNEVQGRFYAVGADIARVEQTIQHIQERERQLKTDLEQTQRDCAEAEEHLAQDLHKAEGWQAELLEIEPELELLNEAEGASSDTLQAAEDAMQAWQQDWDTFNQRAAQPRQQAEVQQSRIQYLEQVQQRLLERTRKLEDEKQGLVVGDVEDQINELEQELAELVLSLEAKQEQSQAAAEQVQTLRERERELAAELDDWRGRHQLARGRQASLEALQQAALGRGKNQSNQWLESAGLAGNPRLADRIKVMAGWEKAVETILAQTLQAVVLEEDFNQSASSLTGLETGSLTLLDGTFAAQAAPESLAEVVSGAPEATALLAGIYRAETLDEALQRRGNLQAHESIVTRDGIWVGPNWVRVTRDQDASAGVIERRQQLEQLETEIAEQQERIESLTVALQECKQNLAETEKTREQARSEADSLVRRQGDLRSRLSAMTAKVEQVLESRRRATAEIAEAREQIQLEAENLAEARAQLQEAIDAMEQDTQAREQLLSRRDELRSQLDRARQKARHDKDRAHELAMRFQSVRTQLQAVNQGIQRLREQMQRMTDRRAKLEESLQESREPVENYKLELEDKLAQRIRVEEELLQARRNLEEVESVLRDAEKQRQQVEHSLQDIRGKLERERLSAQTLEVQAQGLHEQLKEEDFDLDTVLATIPEDLTEAAANEELTAISARISRLGPINLAAIDEYKTESERKQYLDAQNQDLQEALETLENAIRKIDRETRTRFKETFDQINSGLQELFPKVFGGGHAYLELTGEDMLDTGIAIMARPPGKKNSTIHLLSGGEKALTAIALVFSIFRLNPAPFCMLDEVDAPLDDANVGRYARMVEEMSSQVQFIYITHNKIAMEMAHQLMGVTMHEPGVSRIVTVDVEEAAELAAV
jgi:chromosome segregation protein SMC, common bacterial type